MKRAKIAWITPSMGFGFYIQPVLKELSLLFPEFKIFTARWPGFIPGCEDLFSIETVGEYRRLNKTGSESEYDRSFQKLSLGIVPKLFAYNPDVIFITGFSLWSILVTVFKSIGKWKVIVIYSGSSPSIDVLDSSWRLSLRKAIVSRSDAFVTNSQRGEAYLVIDLGAPKEKVFSRPYQIPDKNALLANQPETNFDFGQLKRPSFLFVGQAVKRKGLSVLLEACQLIKQLGYEDFRLIIVGDGAQRQEYETWAHQHGLTDQVNWIGWVNYGGLGFYYQYVDALIFPTFEDIWGMVVLEAMLFGKPILCSSEAGAKEMVKPGYNGFIFNPHSPEEIAQAMISIIENPDLALAMGRNSQEMIDSHTTEAAAEHFRKVIDFVLS